MRGARARPYNWVGLTELMQEMSRGTRSVTPSRKQVEGYGKGQAIGRTRTRAMDERTRSRIEQ